MKLSTVIILLFILLVLYILIGYILYYFVIVSGKNKLFKIIDKQIEEMLKPYKKYYYSGLDFYNKSEKKELHIKAEDGTNLYGTYIEKNNSKYVLILCHGYRSTKERDVFASMNNYYDMGMSILVLDMRGCGKSGGKHITFGYKESSDINKWVDYINKKYHKEVILGGVSLGASSILLVNNKHVKLMIEDSGYENAYKEIKYTLNHYSKLPLSIHAPIIYILTKIFAKSDLKSIKINNNLSKLNIPILFIHGSIDDFVPLKNVYTLYNNYKGPKDILVIDNAPHGMGYLLDKELYIDKIEKFVKKYL